MSTIYLVFLLLFWVAFIVIATTRFKLHPFLALLISGLGFGLTSGISALDVVNTLTTGFGNTLGAIGIVIILGTLIGAFLERTGGAQALAMGLLKLVGERHVALAMGVVGYLVSIPVFCDSGFIILSSLNKALSKRTRTSLAVCAIALSLGLFASHTMVPPTPGPVAAAAIMDAQLASVIIFGLIASLFALLTGWIFAITQAAKFDVPVPEEAVAETPKETAAQAHGVGPLKALWPIILPIVLIILGSVASFPTQPFGEGNFASFCQFIGHPVIALLCGFLAALLLPRKIDREMFSMNGWVGKALISCANILIITGAGGAFGAVLQNSGIAGALGQGLSLQTTFGILLPFVVAAVIKTAQGSSTVAIITAASIISPLVMSLGLDSESGRALTVVAIGAGAMVVSHANDSYFWVVTQFSNMTVSQGYRLQTLGSLVTGISAMLAVLVISLFIS